MMKKISIFFLALILIFSMAGCGAESDPQMSGPADHVESEQIQNRQISRERMKQNFLLMQTRRM